MRRKLKDWMGEDWTLEVVESTDTRLKAHRAHGILDNIEKQMVIAKRDDNSMITTILHEVAHRAAPYLDGDESEELKIDNIALTFKQFLERAGVDLSPLVDA